MPYLNEAVHLYAEGVPIEALDGALEDFGLPMGPLALLDEIGLDVAAKVGKVMADAYPDRMRAARDPPPAAGDGAAGEEVRRGLLPLRG